MMKKLIAVLLSVVTLFALTACSGGAGEKKTIGIIQFGSHASLNNCYDGVMAGLKEAGINTDDYNVEYVNSNFDANTGQQPGKQKGCRYCGHCNPLGRSCRQRRRR